jgi:hypothetical protein
MLDSILLSANTIEGRMQKMYGDHSVLYTIVKVDNSRCTHAHACIVYIYSPCALCAFVHAFNSYMKQA